MSSLPANENDPLLLIPGGDETCAAASESCADLTHSTSTTSDSSSISSGSSSSSSSSSVTTGVCNNYLLDKVADGTDYIVEGARELRKDIVEGVEEVAENVKDAVVEEVQGARDSLMEELNDADQGEMFFLDMGLTRNLSILPSDVVEASGVSEMVSSPLLRVTMSGKRVFQDDDDDDVVVDTNKQKKLCQENNCEKELYIDIEKGLPSYEEMTKSIQGPLPLGVYALLFSAVVSMSSIGPLLDMQESVDSMMKIYWRMTGTWMILIPFAVYSVWKDGLPEFPPDTVRSQLVLKLIISATGYATMCLGFVVALEYTSVGNATIFSNSQALILLAGKLLVGDRVTVVEGVGAVVAFGGAVLCSRDSVEESSSGGEAVWGDVYALVSAMGGVLYMVYAKNLRQHIAVYQFVFVNMFVGSLVVALTMFVMGKRMTLDRDMNHGMFGWMNSESDRLPLEILMIVVCNLLGSMGYARSMQYFDNLTISVACLMEPVMAEFIAFELNVGFLPGW
eukprot:CAMPEP_0202442162 /NCGR_PEP_ID=MMETSP1360-20130828/1620_1 /ASSEMBLY_ACC=CAM_ASM_000848 /TAXON_ID=515479 /ORGANISM="Licmophora paradoxa, Strain CCMP2313" /LENGTH=507 /DNA_ID=CAMNT_0049057435 /DNA_START=92 /DNA_END=1612 /DNA_ORIENTATION=-